jgi:hypothetical protein
MLVGQDDGMHYYTCLQGGEMLGGVRRTSGQVAEQVDDGDGRRSA